MSPHLKQQAYRGVRLVFFTLMSSALFVNTINAWAARYPLIGAGVAALEMLYRYASPVVPGQFEPEVHSVPAPPAGPGLGMPQAPRGVGISNLPDAGSPPGVHSTPEG